MLQFFITILLSYVTTLLVYKTARDLIKLISFACFPIVAFLRNLCRLKKSSKISLGVRFNGKVESELVFAFSFQLPLLKLSYIVLSSL